MSFDPTPGLVPSAKRALANELGYGDRCVHLHGNAEVCGGLDDLEDTRSAADYLCHSGADCVSRDNPHWRSCRYPNSPRRSDLSRIDCPDNGCRIDRAAGLHNTCAAVVPIGISDSRPSDGLDHAGNFWAA